MVGGIIGEASHCAQCGQSFSGAEAFCRHCGAARARGAAPPGSPTDGSADTATPSASSPVTEREVPVVGGVESPVSDASSSQPPPGGYGPPPSGYPGNPQAGYSTPPPGYPGNPQAGYPTPPRGYPGHTQAGYPTPPAGYPAQAADYPAPPPGYPTQPGYPGPPQGGYPAPPAGYADPGTYLPAPQPEQPRTGSGWLIVGVAAATLAIVAIGIGVYAATSGSSGGQAQLVAAPVVRGGSPGGAALPSSPGSSHSVPHSVPLAHATSTPALPPSVTPQPRARIGQITDQQAVSNTIQRHFSLITQHRFSAAYALLAPSLQTGESSWISAHEADGIYKVSVAVNAAVHSPTSATASIAKMRTLDGHGCKLWSGSWGMTKIAGQWRISESNLSQNAC